MVGSMAFVGLVAAAPVPVIRRPTPSIGTYVLLLVAFGLTVDGYLLATFGIRFDLPGLAEVYDVRSSFRDAVGGGVGAIAAGYLVPWAGNAINPLLMTIGIVRRRWLLVVLGLVGQVLIYQVTGFKSILFSVVLVACRSVRGQIRSPRYRTARRDRQCRNVVGIGRRHDHPLLAVAPGVSQSPVCDAGSSHVPILRLVR